MNGHINKKDFIKLIQGYKNTCEISELMIHIEKCPECAKNYRIFKEITAPSPNCSFVPGDHVLDRVMSSYVRHSVKKPVDRKLSIFHPLKVRLAAASIALIMVFFASYSIYIHVRFRSAPVKAFNIAGKVKVNKNELTRGQSLHSGVLLTSGEDSRFAIIYGKIMKLYAGPFTSVYLKKSRIDKKTGKIFFEMVVNKGTISAVFDNAGNLEYTLKTPHGSINSSGSKITMKVQDSKTHVFIKDGSANLSSLSKGDSINTEDGNKYTITNKQVFSAMESSEDSEENGSLSDESVKELMDSNGDDVIVQ